MKKVENSHPKGHRSEIPCNVYLTMAEVHS